MTRAALPSIVRRALAGPCAVQRGDRILLAVSGGPDSMALLDVIARLGCDVIAHGVDHGLRPEAARELDLAEAHAAKLGVPFRRTRVNVPKGGNLQARAREARWSALCHAATMDRARLVATAHHADDRAETVLIRLLHGAGPRGLAVLPPRARSPVDGEVELVRPLLLARKTDIEAYVARHGIPFAQDPSNADPRYLRTRVRHELLPLLVALSPGIIHHLGALADQLAVGFDPDAAPLALPRVTQQAIARLLAESSDDPRRIWLPSGRVLTVERGADRGKSGGTAESAETGRERDKIRAKSTKPERIRPSIKGIGASSLKGPRSS